MALIIDTSTGTVLTAHTCVLVQDDALSETEWEALDSMTDGDVSDLARNRGEKVCTISRENLHKIYYALGESKCFLLKSASKEGIPGLIEDARAIISEALDS